MLRPPSAEISCSTLRLGSRVNNENTYGPTEVQTGDLQGFQMSENTYSEKLQCLQSVLGLASPYATAEYRLSQRAHDNFATRKETRLPQSQRRDTSVRSNYYVGLLIRYISIFTGHLCVETRLESKFSNWQVSRITITRQIQEHNLGPKSQ